jgi:hypothetical protein
MRERWLEGRHWSVSSWQAKNGSKQFGVALWFNSQRACLQLSFWVWEIYVMREK